MTKLLDTNIVLYFLGGKLSRYLPDGDYFVSIITEIELLSYPKLNKKAEAQIKSFLSEISIVDIQPEIKDLTIALRRKYKIKLPDAIIAATALNLDAELLSNDQLLLQIPNLRCKSLALKS